MIAAASETIGPRHRANPVRRDVASTPPLNEPCEGARRRILRPFRVHAYRRAVDDAVAALVVPDDVVVEHRLDWNLLGDRFLRVQARTDEPLLLARVTHEHERRVEIDAALAEHARELNRQRRSASVVIDAGREIVERRIRIGGPRRRRVRIGRSAGVGRALPPGARDGVVVTADVHATRAAAWKNRHHVAQFDRPRDPSLWRDLVRVEAHLERRAVAFHLVEDPLPRGADAARRRIGRRQRAARPEALELLQNRSQPLFGDRSHQLHDARIEIAAWRRSLRSTYPAEAGCYSCKHQHLCKHQHVGEGAHTDARSVRLQPDGSPHHHFTFRC